MADDDERRLSARCTGFSVREDPLPLPLPLTSGTCTGDMVPYQKAAWLDLCRTCLLLPSLPQA
jgi:hypothetical protein